MIKKLLLSCLLLCSLHAAEIDWQPPQSITGTLTDFVTDGDLVSAHNGGNATVTIDPGGLNITFTPGLSLGRNPFDADPATRQDSRYDSLLAQASWNTSPQTLNLTGLTSGTDYLIQLWIADTRSCCMRRQKTYDSGPGTESVTLDSGLPSEFVIGTFTADGSTQALRFVGSGAAHPQFNAIQVRTTGPSINSFEISNPNLSSDTAILHPPNTSATLTWATNGTSSVTISGVGTFGPSGSTSVPIGSSSQTFTLTAGDQTAQVSAIVDLSPTSPLINEFLANTNSNSLSDEDGDNEDWIEILNPNPYAISLSGYHLSDDPLNNTLWTFPANTTLQPNSFLVIFASGKDRTNSASNLHTNFSLTSAGDQLTLFAPNGSTPLSAFTWNTPFPSGVSFGPHGTPPTNELFATPSPNASNTPPFYLEGRVIFSEPSRTFSSSLSLTLTPEVSGMEIRFTTDNSVPTATSTLYTSPLTLNNTSVIRARLVDPSNRNRQGEVSGRHYIALSSASIPANCQAGAPNLSSFTSNLPIIIIDSFNGGATRRGVFTTTSFTVMEPVNGTTSLTQLPTAASRAAYRVRGASSSNFPKQQYRLEIRNQEDQDKDLSLLGLPAEADWVLGAPYTDKSLIRNPFVFELGREIGLTAPRTQHFEIFVNEDGGPLNYQSDYRGVYFLSEVNEIGNDRIDIERLRPDQNSVPEITGGYLMKWEFGAAAPSQLLPGWSTLELDDPDPESEATDAQKNWISDHIRDIDTRVKSANFRDPVQGYEPVLNLPSYANLIAINELTRDQDAYMRSAYIHKDRNQALTMGPLWDYNLTMGNGCCRNNRDINGWQYIENNNVNEHQWEVRLFQDIDFEQRFIDRWQELRRNQLSDVNLHARMDDIAAPLIGGPSTRNFAKWDNLNTENVGFDTPTTATWEGQIDFMKTWTTDRMNWIDDNFVDPPTISPSGGAVSSGTPANITAPTGTVYYTTDGSDPRANNGAISPSAILYNGPINITSTTTFTARARLNSSNWSGLDVDTFIVGTPASSTNLVISEIHYHPADPTLAEINEGFTNQDNFEFIELLNISEDTISLASVTFSNGIDFAFPTSATLAPNERIVIVSNQDAFTTRYPSIPISQIAGEFQNLSNLRNGGEVITLNAADSSIIQTFDYDDSAPWPDTPDGSGPSLVLLRPYFNPDHNEPLNWRPSLSSNGTPTTTNAGVLFTGSTEAELLTHVTNDVPASVQQLPDGSFDYTVHLNQISENTEVTLEVSTDLRNWSPISAPATSITPTTFGFANHTFIIPSGTPKIFFRKSVISR